MCGCAQRREQLVDAARAVIAGDVAAAANLLTAVGTSLKADATGLLFRSRKNAAAHARLKR